HHLSIFYLLSSPTPSSSPFFSFNDPAPPNIHTLSLHDALPIYRANARSAINVRAAVIRACLPGVNRNTHAQRYLWRPFLFTKRRSEEHTSELQSPYDLVCRLLLEKKKKKKTKRITVTQHTVTNI